MDRYYDIIDYHTIELNKKLAKIDQDLKRKLRILYISGFVLGSLLVVGFVSLL